MAITKDANVHVQRLRSLDVFPDTPKRPNSVRENAELFRKCATMSILKQEIPRSSCSLEQFLYFHLEALLKKDPEFRSSFLKEAKEKLGGLGISAEHIEEYFQNGCGDPEMVLYVKHEGRYDIKAVGLFCEKADQFALDKMRQWLGYS